MELISLQQALNDQMQTTPLNAVQPEIALLPELAGLPYFEADCLMGAAAAEDPLFVHFQDAAVVGPHHWLPANWLPGAKTVIAFFFPYTAQVRTANARSMDWPDPLWLHGRIEGQLAIRQATERLVQLLREAGYQAVAPLLDERFLSVGGKARSGPAAHIPLFSSNWSERHAAFAAGLGTFCLSRGMITAKGVAGRFGSVITDAVLTPTPRPYTDPFDYCIRCGQCAKNCPADAFPADGGVKDHAKCSAFLGKVRTDPASGGRYGCAKCQVQVPCETGIPLAARKRLGLL